MRTPRPLLALLTAGALATSLAACSFSAGELEEVGGEETAAANSDSTGAAEQDPTDDAADTGELQTIQASHITAQVPTDWAPVEDEDPWKFIHQLPSETGGVAGRIAFMPGGKALSPQESVDWFISQIEGTGQTDDNFAPITTLRSEENRANTSYTYTSGDETYVAVVWGITDNNGAPSLIQLSGVESVITQDFVAQVDQSLDLTGDWEESAQ